MSECARKIYLNQSNCAVDSGNYEKIALEAGNFACAACIPDVVKKLSKEANTDFATGLLNRRGLDKRIEEYSDRHQRTGLQFGLIQIDIVNFKTINNVMGQTAGDKAIKTFADTFRSKRETDKVAYLGADDEDERASRLGGDEFAILMDLSPRRDDVDRSDQAALNRLIRAGIYFQQQFNGLEDVAKINDAVADANQHVGMRFGISMHSDGMGLDEHLALSDPKKFTYSGPEA